MYCNTYWALKLALAPWLFVPPSCAFYAFVWVTCSFQDLLDLQIILKLGSFLSWPQFFSSSLGPSTITPFIFKIPVLVSCFYSPPLFMSISPTAVVKMPSENSFKKQADIARDALKNFNTVRALNVPSLVKTALSELVEATVSFIFPMSISFISHVLNFK
jgi:hypothetical protein